MSFQKFSAPEPLDANGFVVTDLDDCERATGVVRAAKKILVDGARTLARSQTYAWALLGENISGCSAGLNTVPSELGAATAAFVEMAGPSVESGVWSFDAAKGVPTEALAPLDTKDSRGPLRNTEVAHGVLSDQLLAQSVCAAATAVLGSLDAQRVAIDGAGPSLAELIAVLARHGARIVAVQTPAGVLHSADGLDPTDLSEALSRSDEAVLERFGSSRTDDEVVSIDADVLVCGSRVGLIGYEVAAQLPHRVVVPIGPAPVTARGLAVATHRGIVVVPDFLSMSGPLHSYWAPPERTALDCNDAAVQHVVTVVAAASEHPDGLYLGSCQLAEEHLRTWRDELPFGRPLA